MKVRITLKQLRVGAFITALMLLVGLAGFKFGQKQNGAGNCQAVVVDRSQPADKSQIDLSLFWKVWDRLGNDYLIKSDLKPQEMVWGAIKGMTAALGDPYTVFLPPAQQKASQEELDGAFEGVGIELGFKDKHLAVVAPLTGTPAEIAGIKPGDYIVNIKDETKSVDVNTMEMSLPEAVKIIRGPKGSTVVLTILRDGEVKTREIAVVRDTIVIKSVELSWAGDDKTIAHLQLTRFGGRTEDEWEEAVDEITAKGSQVKGVVLDLRNNPGGYLQGAVRYASEFLDRGKIVVKQEDSKGNVENYSVDRDGKLKQIKLVVLINEGSASSSEILAGALRDYQRAKLVGKKSFGKGTIQEALDLNGSAGLHVTTAKWLTPNNTWVNETKGIEPDEVVELDLEAEKDTQLQKAIEILLNN